MFTFINTGCSCAYQWNCCLSDIIETTPNYMYKFSFTCLELLTSCMWIDTWWYLYDIDLYILMQVGSWGSPVKPEPLWYLWLPSYRNKHSIAHRLDCCLMMLIQGWLVVQGFISLVREGNYHRSCCPSNTKETTPNYIVYSYYSWCRLLWWYLYTCMQWQLSVQSVITTEVMAPLIPVRQL